MTSLDFNLIMQQLIQNPELMQSSMQMAQQVMQTQNLDISELIKKSNSKMKDQNMSVQEIEITAYEKSEELNPTEENREQSNSLHLKEEMTRNAIDFIVGKDLENTENTENAETEKKKEKEITQETDTEKKLSSSNCFDGMGNEIQRPSTKLEDVVGHQAAKEDILDIIRALQDPGKLKRIGAKLRRGLLLSGPSGVGKTMLAKSVANATQCAFVSVTCSDLLGFQDEDRMALSFGVMDVDMGPVVKQVTEGISMFTKNLSGEDKKKQQDSLYKLRKIFEQARAHAPTILFIDEFDLLSEKKEFVAELLTQLDGFVDRSNDQVVIIGATNKLSSIDPRLMRPGRFDHVVELRLPREVDRIELFHRKTQNIRVDEIVKEAFPFFAQTTSGFSGAEIEGISMEAARLAVREDLDCVTIKQFEEAIDRVYLGYKKNTIRTPQEEKRISIHEAGHALCSMLLELKDKQKGLNTSYPCIKATIVPHELSEGVVFSRHDPDVFLTKRMYENQIRVCFAGGEAEKLFLGEDEQSDGCGTDIMKIREICKALSQANLLPFLPSNPSNMERWSSSEDVKLISHLEKLRLETQYLLTFSRPTLEKLVDALMSQKTLNRKQLEELCVN